MYCLKLVINVKIAMVIYLVDMFGWNKKRIFEEHANVRIGWSNQHTYKVFLIQKYIYYLNIFVVFFIVVPYMKHLLHFVDNYATNDNNLFFSEKQ